MADGATPNTTPQNNTAKPTQCCPLAEEKPCDVDALSVTVKAFDDDNKGVGAQTGGRKPVDMYLQTTKKLRGQPVKDAKGKVFKDDFLGVYDLVFETIADYAEGTKSHSDQED